jgi:hypothetical protein
MKKKIEIFELYDILDYNEKTTLCTGTLTECAEALRGWIDDHTIAEIEELFQDHGDPALFLTDPEAWFQANGNTEVWYDWTLEHICSADARLTPTEFHEIRNSIYNGLIENNLVGESDKVFMTIDSLLGSVLPVDWEK